MILAKFLTSIVLFVLLALGVFSQRSYARAGLVYQVLLEYNQGKILSKNISVVPGYIPEQIKPSSDRELKAVLTNSSQKVVFRTSFRVPNRVFYDEFNLKTGAIQGTSKQIAKIDWILTLPYFEKGQTISILNSKREKLLDIDVSRFSRNCGDGICRGLENSQNCSQDCPVSLREKLRQQDTSRFLVATAAGGVFIFLLFLIFMVKYKKHK